MKFFFDKGAPVKYEMPNNNIPEVPAPLQSCWLSIAELQADTGHNLRTVE